MVFLCAQGEPFSLRVGLTLWVFVACGGFCGSGFVILGFVACGVFVCPG